MSTTSTSAPCAHFNGTESELINNERNRFVRVTFSTQNHDAPDKFWTLDDLESTDAPHVPVVLPYVERLATFRDLNEVAEPVLLGGEPYRQLVSRLRDATWWLAQPLWLRSESRRVFRGLRDTTVGTRGSGR